MNSALSEASDTLTFRMGCIHSQSLVLSKREVDNKYEEIRHLDSGTYGRVYLAKDRRTSEEVAIKYISREDINKYVRAEVLNLSICRHPQVIAFKEVRHLPILISTEMAAFST